MQAGSEEECPLLHAELSDKLFVPVRVLQDPIRCRGEGLVRR